MTKRAKELELKAKAKDVVREIFRDRQQPKSEKKINQLAAQMAKMLVKTVA